MGFAFKMGHVFPMAFPMVFQAIQQFRSSSVSRWSFCRLLGNAPARDAPTLCPAFAGTPWRSPGVPGGLSAGKWLNEKCHFNATIWCNMVQLFDDFGDFCFVIFRHHFLSYHFNQIQPVHVHVSYAL